MKKEDFFEILGGLDDDIVEEARAVSKKKGDFPAYLHVNLKACYKTCVGIAVAVCAVAVVWIGAPGDAADEPDRDSAAREHTSDLKPVINFEGIVVKVTDGEIVLENGTLVLITENTVFPSGADFGEAISRDIKEGNFIQGYTKDDADAGKITAYAIWKNESAQNAGE